MSFFSNLRSAGALPVEGHLPGFDGATGWLNSPPLSAAELQGKVVLVDFWTYTCINWLRTLAYVRAWAEKYEDQGLVVVGVHTPEFPFERDVDNVRQAVKDMGVEYPVALDSDYAIWQAFANSFWPAVYIADAEGRIRHHQFGEGGYARMRNGHPAAAARVRTRRRPARPRVGRCQGFRGSGRLGEPGVSRDVPRLRASTWLRISRRCSPRPDSHLRRARTVESEPLGARRGLDDRASGERARPRGGRILFRFHARDVHLVMGPRHRGASVPFRVLIDGEPPGDAHGLDVDEQGHGTVVQQRLYQLIRQPGSITDRTFEITFLAPGVEAYVFTFG